MHTETSSDRYKNVSVRLKINQVEHTSYNWINVSPSYKLLATKLRNKENQYYKHVSQPKIPLQDFTKNTDHWVDDTTPRRACVTSLWPAGMVGQLRVAEAKPTTIMMLVSHWNLSTLLSPITDNPKAKDADNDSSRCEVLHRTVAWQELCSHTVVNL